MYFPFDLLLILFTKVLVNEDLLRNEDFFLSVLKRDIAL